MKYSQNKNKIQSFLFISFRNHVIYIHLDIQVNSTHKISYVPQDHPYHIVSISSANMTKKKTFIRLCILLSRFYAPCYKIYIVWLFLLTNHTPVSGTIQSTVESNIYFSHGLVFVRAKRSLKIFKFFRSTIFFSF